MLMDFYQGRLNAEMKSKCTSTRSKGKGGKTYTTINFKLNCTR